MPMAIAMKVTLLEAGGVSGGAIAGIVIGVIAGVMLLLGGVGYWKGKAGKAKVIGAPEGSVKGGGVSYQS